MTEADWLSATDPGPMLDHVRATATDRKLRLFACACCRRVWPLLEDVRSREAVNVAERYADALLDGQDLTEAWEAAHQVTVELTHIARHRLREARGKRRSIVREAYALAGAAEAAELCACNEPRVYPYPWETDCGGGLYDARSISLIRAAYDEVYRDRGDQVRELFGNPFQPAIIETSWLTQTVVDIARGVYEERAFDRLPILADALLDAGCGNEEMLVHCRDTARPHARGCWVVDQLTGRS